MVRFAGGRTRVAALRLNARPRRVHRQETKTRCVPQHKAPEDGRAAIAS